MSAVIVLSAAGESLAGNAEMWTPYGGVRGGASYMLYDEPELQTISTRDLDFFDYREDYDSGDAGYMVGLAVGNDFSRAGIPIRVELEYMYRDNMNYELDYVTNFRAHDARYRMKVQSSTLMLNGYYDIYEEEEWRIWGALGFGFAFSTVEGRMDANPRTTGGTSFSDQLPTRDRTEFAWSVGAGGSIDLTDRLVMDAGYRFINLGKATSGYSSGTFPEEINANITAHELWLGTRYKF